MKTCKLRSSSLPRGHSHSTNNGSILSFQLPGTRRRATGRAFRIIASSADNKFPTPTSYRLWPTELAISAGAYNAIQASELLFYGAVVDAGFSGDWSRIGVLTTDQELLAQQLWWFILVAHSVVAAITVRYALQHGYPPVLAGVKGLLFGSLGLYDVYLRIEADRAQQI